MTPSASDISARRQAFRLLHAAGCFVMPNPWDAGGARYLQGLGFKALATTSAGAAWRLAQPDGQQTREQVLAHLREIVAATELPVNADFESGFASDAAGVAESVRMAVDTGVAGLSIEDSTGVSGDPPRSIEVSVERIRAARAAIDETGGETLLVARAENFVVGRPDLDDAIARLRAYAQAGADCLYAPGIHSPEQIAQVVAAVAPKPVNLLVGSNSALTVAQIADLGVRRISVGGGLARAAWGGFIRAARTLADSGRFDGFADAAPGGELNAFFRIGAGSATTLAADVVGAVQYREGDGPMLEIRPGPVNITLSPGDATFSWVEGEWHGEASMPFVDFCLYVTRGAIVMRDAR